MKVLNKLLVAVGLAVLAQVSFAHGDVTPQAVDTSKLPQLGDRKSTRLNSSHSQQSRMPSSA